MTLPSELMFKIWDGDALERFTATDLNRIEYNANLIADAVGVPATVFIEADRTQQFRYDEAQKLEMLISSVADAAGVSVPTDPYWAPLRSVSCVDFDRWESSLFTIYKALGGLGERIPAGRVLVTYSAVLFASSWTGNGPFSIDLDVPSLHGTAEALAYVPHTATVEQRTAEINAVLQTQTLSDRRIRITALGRRPSVDLPIRISMEGLDMFKSATLTASGWSGSGPYTQSVTLPSAPVNAVVGQADAMTEAQVLASMKGLLCVSAINGSTVTVQALGDKPTIDIPVGILYETEATA